MSKRGSGSQHKRLAARQVVADQAEGGVEEIQREVMSAAVIMVGLVIMAVAVMVVWVAVTIFERAM